MSLSVIAFYSIGTPYEEEAKILTGSLDRVGMRHVVKGFKSAGSWYANTAHKAELIQNARRTMEGPLLYIDVDAFVHVNCTAYFEGLAKEGYDFGAHMFAGPAKGKNKHDVCRCLVSQNRAYGAKGCDRDHRLLSGTLFIGDTPNARNLLDNWVTLNATLKAMGLVQGGGQKNLWYLTTCMEQPKGPLKIAKLPGRYCYVYDKGNFYVRGEPKIIEHTIGSRENRDAIRVNHGRQKRIAELKELVT